MVMVGVYLINFLCFVASLYVNKHHSSIWQIDSQLSIDSPRQLLFLNNDEYKSCL